MTVARACADGFAHVVVVELASLRDPDATVQLIAERARRRATSASHAGANDREFIHDRAVLLVLDNCEHVLSAVVPLVQRLVVTARDSPCWRPVVRPWACPASSSTSSHRSACQRLERSATRLDPLAAVRLFADRAAEARPGFQLDERSLAAAAEICRRLDGLPLAIELAARGCARSEPKLWRTASISASPCSPASPASLDPRHRSLHQLVEWSTSCSTRRPASFHPLGGVRRQLRSRSSRSRVPDAGRPRAPGACRD